MSDDGLWSPERTVKRKAPRGIKPRLRAAAQRPTAGGRSLRSGLAVYGAAYSNGFYGRNREKRPPWGAVGRCAAAPSAKQPLAKKDHPRAGPFCHA